MEPKIPLLPLTDDDIKRIKKGILVLYTQALIFFPIGIGCAFLLLITFTDPGFRSPDSYFVALFLAFIGFMSTWLTVFAIKKSRILKHAFNEGRKKIFTGELVKIDRYGSIKLPRSNWIINVNGWHCIIQIEALDRSFRDMKKFPEIKEGDHVEVQLISDSITLSIQKIK
jgi:hypothetical protein